MLVPKSIALALLSFSVSVSAFTAPIPSLLCTKSKMGPSQFQSPSYKSAESSLKFWKKDDAQNPSSVPAINTYVDETFKEREEEVPASTLTLIGSSLFSFSYVMQRLQIYLNTPCLEGGRGNGNLCTEELYDFSKYFEEHQFLSFVMILTHSIPFVLLPWVSKQVSEMGPVIKRDFEGFNPFLMQMAMACMGFGLSLEFGWHVADSWYYENNFHVLNFGFYFFLISGFALWADGFRNIPIMDLVFGGILAAATALYPFGNAAEVGQPYPEFLTDLFTDGGSSAKIPLYAGMTATFLEITRRGQEIFGKKMYAVPFFCIVINLGFIGLLNGVQYGNAVVGPDGIKELTSLNYVYHICHDILGTELGVLIFGLLIKNYIPVAKRVEE